MTTPVPVDQVGQPGPLGRRERDDGYPDDLVPLGDDEATGRPGVVGRQPATSTQAVERCFVFSLMRRVLTWRPADLRTCVGDMSSTKAAAA